jgi:hypothetical protein
MFRYIYSDRAKTALGYEHMRGEFFYKRITPAFTLMLRTVIGRVFLIDIKQHIYPPAVNRCYMINDNDHATSKVLGVPWTTLQSFRKKALLFAQITSF